jgi:hypothetical protein
VGCPEVFRDEDVEELVADGELVEKYKFFKRNIEVNIDGGKKW